MNDYFVWGDHRILLDLGVLTLPFSLSYIGLFVGFLVHLGASPLLIQKIWGTLDKNNSAKKRKKSASEQEAPIWQSTLLFGGFLLAGNMLGLALGFNSGHEVGPIQLRWYSVLFASAFVAGYFIGRRLFLDNDYPVAKLESALTHIMLGTVVGARLGHCLFYDPIYYLSNPIKILMVWEGGLASHGALIGVLVAIYLFTKKNPEITWQWLVDRTTIPVCVGGAFIRLGNFFNSEIIGHPTEVAWAVIFTEVDPLPRHPSMLYESLFCWVILAALWGIYKKYDTRPPEGLLFGAFLVLLFSFRFLVELTKIEQAHFYTGGLNMGQWLSIPLVILGFWFLYRSLKEQKTT